MLKSTTQISQREPAPATDPVGVAVVGLGYWGPNLLRVLGDNLDASVRWICDLDSERLVKYRRRHPDARMTTKIERVLADPAVDAVIIATPVHTHYNLAARVLEAGKHVFVEKPLASSSELADRLADMAAARAWAAEELSLPMHPDLTAEEVEHVAEAVIEAAAVTAKAGAARC